MPVLAFRERKLLGRVLENHCMGTQYFVTRKKWTVLLRLETYPTQPKLPKVGCVVFVCSYTVLYCSENVIMILNINSI